MGKNSNNMNSSVNGKFNKKTMVIIISIVVAVLVLLGILAIIFLKTDLFLNDKQAFLKYVAQIYSEEKGFAQDELGVYFDKRNNTPFKNEGGFRVNVSSKESDSKYNVLNNCNFLFNGKTDKKNNKSEQNLTIKYAENVTFPIQYKTVGPKTGVKLEDIADKSIIFRDGEKLTTGKTIVVDEQGNVINKTLDEINKEKENNESNNDNFVTASESIGGDVIDTSEVLENNSSNLFGLSVEDILLGSDKYKLSNEEKKDFQKKFALGLVKRLNKDKFVKVYEENTGYRLKLKQREIKAILIGTLEELKIEKQDKENVVDYINYLIKNVNKYFETDKEELEVSITVYQKGGKIIRFSVDVDEYIIDITKGKKKDGTNYVFKITYKEKDTYLKSLTLDTTFGGLIELSKIYENYKLTIEFTDKEYEYSLNNLVEFKDSVDIEDFNKDNSVNLNDYKPRNVFNFFNAVGKKVKLNHKRLMAEIGLSENQNPLIYMIPDFQEIPVEQPETDEDEMKKVNDYNAKFEKYKGGNIKGVTIKGLLRVVKSTNDDKENNNGYTINNINFNGEEKDTSDDSMNFIISELDKDKAKEYKIDFEKNPTIGVIDGIIIMDKDKALEEDKEAAKEENKEKRKVEQEEKDKANSEIQTNN